MNFVRTRELAMPIQALQHEIILLLQNFVQLIVNILTIACTGSGVEFTAPDCGAHSNVKTDNVWSRAHLHPQLLLWARSKSIDIWIEFGEKDEIFSQWSRQSSLRHPKISVSSGYEVLQRRTTKNLRSTQYHTPRRRILPQPVGTCRRQPVYR